MSVILYVKVILIDLRALGVSGLVVSCTGVDCGYVALVLGHGAMEMNCSSAKLKISTVKGKASTHRHVMHPRTVVTVSPSPL